MQTEKTCILFSGQGSQYQGMGKELIMLFPQLQNIYDCASDILGMDLKELCFNASAEELAKTQIAQPAIMATSLVAYEAVKTLGIVPDCVAGHSLGEYAAMVASGMLSMESGFRVIKERAYAMSECTKNQDGAMCAIMGVDADEIAKICETVDGYVVPVNYNSPAQTVIAGESGAVAKAMEIFEGMGKRAVRLAVSAAFHSKLMQDAADMFYGAIQTVEFKTPTVDFYSNTSGKLITDFSAVPAYLKAHLVSPVRFVDELNLIAQNGVTRFVECGPNKVLTGLVRKTLKEVKVFSVEDEKTFLKLKES